METATVVRNPSGTVAYGASASPRTENIHAAAPTLETGDWRRAVTRGGGNEGGTMDGRGLAPRNAAARCITCQSRRAAAHSRRQ